MSEGQINEAEPQTRYGSRFARMFGFVTPDDRSQWEQRRAQNAPNVSAARQTVKASTRSMLEFGERNINAKLDAAHRVAAQQQFDESHDKIVNRHQDPRTRSIVETVDYEPRDDRDTIEPDLEM